MKSSTLVRSNLTREAMDVIETLSNENNEETAEKTTFGEETPEEYYRHEDNTEDNSLISKAQEIDLLWQNFKASQFNTQSPATYVTIGFICGVITSVIIAAIFGYFISKPDISMPKIDFSKFNIGKIENISGEDHVETQTSAKVVVPTEDDTPAVAETKVQEDTTIREEHPQATTSESSSVKVRQHTVKNGETVEAIIKHYYGSYTPERAEKIKQANNLTTLDRINIDQVLIIPEE